MSNPYYKAQIRKELEGIVAYSKNGSIADGEIEGIDIKENDEIML